MGLFIRKKQKGFTLIELLTAIFIITVIATIIFPNIRKAFYRANLSGCQSNLRNMATAVEIYNTDTGNYPDKLERIVPERMRKLPECPAAGKETYSAGYEVVTDPAAYTIHCSGDNHGITGLNSGEPYYSGDSGLHP
ncbi:MAG: prepilin-type N-terminal cleavage/methylation domain-containing protein [Firmicutes bacterium]|nr:prepilin-type N-terminal cleavage/methylation domain-containing protein [Bacillota bacterium]